MTKKDDIKKQIYGNPNWINGRINRAEYFTRVFLLSITLGVCVFASDALEGMGSMSWSILLYAFALWVYWRIAMAYVKRFHDLGWSGWFAIFFVFDGAGRVLFNNEILIGVFDAFVLVLSLLLLFRKGSNGVNKYGKDPLMKYEENQ